MGIDDRDQEAVAAILRKTPQSEVPTDFLARVNARIDETAGWLGLADFRAWTLGLAPAAAALALVAVLWPFDSAQVRPAPQAASPTDSPVTQSAAATFSPASSGDWQSDVSGDALLEAALAPAGAVNVR